MTPEKEILKKLPPLKLTPTDWETAQMCGQPWLIHAQETEGMLILSFFAQDTPVDGLPYARTVFSKDEFLTERPGLEAKKRFTSASFSYTRDEKLYDIGTGIYDGQLHKYRDNCAFASYAEMVLARSMLRSLSDTQTAEMSVSKLICKKQEQVLSDRLRGKQEKRNRKEKEEWGCVNPVPEGFWTFAKEHILKDSQYGTYQGKTHLSCQCGMCGEKFTLHRKKDNIKRNAPATCPKCGKHLIMLPSGQLPHKYTSDHVAFVDPADGKRTIFRIFKFTRDWDKTEEGYREETTSYEYGRIIIYTDIINDGTLYHRHRVYARDEEKEWKFSPSGELRPPRPMMYYYDDDPAWRHYLYPEGLDKALGTLPATCFGLEEYARQGLPQRYFSYIVCSGINFLSIEDKRYLASNGHVESGFRILDRNARYWSRHPKEKDTICGLDAKHLRILLEFEQDTFKIFDYALQLLWNQQEMLRKGSKKHLTAEAIRFFYENGVSRGSAEKLAEEAAGLSFGKIVKYLTKQTTNGLSVKTAAELLSDYCKMRRNCGLPCGEAQLTPKELVNAHDELMLIDNARKAEEQRQEREKRAAEIEQMEATLTEQIRKRAEALEEALKKVMDLSEDGLIAQFPYTAKEFFIEGDVLHHCINGYRKDFAKGLTVIVFIRNEAAPDVPYYTLETKNGQIVQLHGMYNDIRTETVVQPDGSRETITTTIPIPDKVKAFAEKIAKGLAAAA